MIGRMLNLHVYSQKNSCIVWVSVAEELLEYSSHLWPNGTTTQARSARHNISWLAPLWLSTRMKIWQSSLADLLLTQSHPDIIR